MRSLPLLLALCATLALAACGVKGPLEPPPGAQVSNSAAKPATPPPQPATTTASGKKDPNAPAYVPPRTAAELYETATPHADWEKQKKPPTANGVQQQLLKDVNRPDQPFVLDGLL